MPKKTNKSAPDFEQAMQDLEDLVNNMESGELSLEASLKQFEEGVKLTRICQKALSEAEQKVSILMNKTVDTDLDDFEST